MFGITERGDVAFHGFNTDDGIRRAAIPKKEEAAPEEKVSIPMTVLGGLQFISRYLFDVKQEKFQYR